MRLIFVDWHKRVNKESADFTCQLLETFTWSSHTGEIGSLRVRIAMPTKETCRNGGIEVQVGLQNILVLICKSRPAGPCWLIWCRGAAGMRLFDDCVH